MKKASGLFSVFFVLLMFLFTSCGKVNEKSNIIEEVGFSSLGYDITAEDVLDYGRELLCSLDEDFFKLVELAFPEKKESVYGNFLSNNTIYINIKNYISKLEPGSSEFNRIYSIRELFNVFPKIREVFSSSLSYRVGARGPAGGYIFYDCDADNDSGNKDGLKSSKCGWRYLEAAPKDLPKKYVWGDSGKFGTKVGVGEGRANTEIIVREASKKKFNNAALACWNYSEGEYSDWFLPSSYELYLMYENLKRKSIGNFVNDVYWSSSEEKRFLRSSRAYYQNFSSGDWDYGKSKIAYLVRPIRAFI